MNSFFKKYSKNISLVFFFISVGFHFTTYLFSINAYEGKEIPYTVSSTGTIGILVLLLLVFYYV